MTHDLTVHVLIISLLFYTAIAVHYLTLKIQKHETQKTKKREPKKVLHSKQGRYSSINDELPFTEPLTEKEKQNLTKGL